MLDKPPPCNECILAEKGIAFTQPDGLGTSGLMVIGEAPGKSESEQGIPFVGRAGKQLDRSLSRIGVDRHSLIITNLIQCRPPNNWLQGSPWEEGSITHCRTHHLLPTIMRFKPRVISTQGALPLKYLLGLDGLLPSARNNAPKRGYVFDCRIPLPDGTEHECKVIPTVHPSFVIQGNQNFAGVHYYDLKKAWDMCQNSAPAFETEFVTHPKRKDVRDFIQRAKESSLELLSADIETYYSGNKNEDELTLKDQNIVRISFAFDGCYAITLLTRGNRDLIQEIFDIKFKHICWWNGMNFDIPLLHRAGYGFKATHLDGMVAWKFLQSDLPQGLGFVSTFYTPFPEWKSLSDDEPEYYSCMDAVACWLCTKGIIDTLKGQEVASEEKDSR